MKIYDISLPLCEALPVYPGDTPFKLEFLLRIEQGGHCNLSWLTMGSHSGTHVDAPYHFESQGKRVEEVDISLLVGPARVLELAPCTSIGKEELERAGAQEAERLLFKTTNSTLWSRREFQPDYVYLTPEAARYLADTQVKLVGIDYLSLEAYQSQDHAAHHILLSRGIVILEGLNLQGIAAGDYTLVCLPLKIKGAEGAPARAILIEA